MSAAAGLTTLAEMVRDRAKTRGDATAFEFEGCTTTFAEFNITTNRVGNGLKALDVRPHERIAYAAPAEVESALCDHPDAADVINFTRERIEDAAVGRFHRGAAAQPVGQGPASSPARSLLSGQGPAGELSTRPSPRAWIPLPVSLSAILRRATRPTLNYRIRVAPPAHH
jgi:hypothetical protein